MSDVVLENQQAADCLLPMGITSASSSPRSTRSLLSRRRKADALPSSPAGENVATEYKISRDQQDAFAATSFQRAEAAQKAGKFKSEIVPVRTKWTDPKTDEEREITVTEDDGIRAGTTKESLSKLKPVFSKTGSTHAGNASQVRPPPPLLLTLDVELVPDAAPSRARRSRTAPLPSSSRAAPRRRSSASRSSPRCATRPSPASSPSSWASAPRSPSPRCSRRRA